MYRSSLSLAPNLVSTFILMVLVIINPIVVFVRVHCTCTIYMYMHIKRSLLLLCVNLKNLGCSFMMHPMGFLLAPFRATGVLE